MNLNTDALVEIRRRSGINQSALATRAGIDRTLLNKIERGERTATDAVIVKLAAGLKCPLLALIDGTDDAAGAA